MIRLRGRLLKRHDIVVDRTGNSLGSRALADSAIPCIQSAAVPFFHLPNHSLGHLQKSPVEDMVQVPPFRQLRLHPVAAGVEGTPGGVVATEANPQILATPSTVAVTSTITAN